MSANDSPWIVEEITLTKEAKAGPAHYKYHVRGTIRESGAPYSWTVPSLDGYDTSRVTIPSLPNQGGA